MLTSCVFVPTQIFTWMNARRQGGPSILEMEFCAPKARNITWRSGQTGHKQRWAELRHVYEKIKATADERTRAGLRGPPCSLAEAAGIVDADRVSLGMQVPSYVKRIAKLAATPRQPRSAPAPAAATEPAGLSQA